MATSALRSPTGGHEIIVRRIGDGSSRDTSVGTVAPSSLVTASGILGGSGVLGLVMWVLAPHWPDTLRQVLWLAAGLALILAGVALLSAATVYRVGQAVTEAVAGAYGRAVAEQSRADQVDVSQVLAAVRELGDQVEGRIAAVEQRVDEVEETVAQTATAEAIMARVDGGTVLPMRPHGTTR